MRINWTKLLWIFSFKKNEKAGHNTILHSLRAVAYQDKVEKDLKRMKDKYDRDLTQAEMTKFCNELLQMLKWKLNGKEVKNKLF